MENVLGFIFARGGSKGVPGKNLRPLGGKPLIGRAIECALSTRALSRVIVSTDCPKIAQTALNHGAEVPFLRPAELASDTAPERLAWRHAIEEVERIDDRRVDVLVSVPPTCPLRAPEDVDRCIDRLLGSDADIVLTVTETTSNPFFNMVTCDSEGNAQLAIPPASEVVRRQDAPKVYDLTAVAYAARRNGLFAHESIFDSRALTVTVPRERAIDIDTEDDLALAEFYLNRNELNAHRPAA